MSARGARSRKAVAKDIEKKEKKIAQKQKAPVDSARRAHDPFAEWGTTTPTFERRDAGMPSRSYTVSSDATRGTSRSSSTNPSHATARLDPTIDSFDIRGFHRQRTSASESASIVSDGSGTGKDKAKYQAHGKETKAPRGRGGGVPVKKPVGLAIPPTPVFRMATNAASHGRSNQKTWANFRIWQGGENGIRPYGGFDFDEHMQHGNVLIYFKEEQTSEDRPIPQIRADLDVLENSGSTWLSHALLHNQIDNTDDDWAVADGSESSGPHHVISSQAFPQPPGQRQMLSPTSPGGTSPPPFDIDQAYFGVPGNGTASRARYYTDMNRSGGSSSPPPFPAQREQNPSHELWFAAPSCVKTPQGQRLHHVAIRNFLALLHNKPIVGSDLFEMLSTLQPEIEVMYELDYDVHSKPTPRERSIQMITDYLIQHTLDDIRNSIKLALGILAWAEQDNVKWRQGYLESFVHLAGILSPQIEELPEYKRLSIVTRRNLGIAAKQLELRVMEAEEKLCAFDFSDIWEEAAKANTASVYQSYMAFRQFLVGYYTRLYGCWLPKQSKTWLNRKIVLALQRDFGALYDYLVNRDVVWDSREERPGKKWQMINTKTEDFNADSPELSLTGMLVSFDNQHGYLHIPHPYPLLPREVPTCTKTVQKKGLFGGLKKSKTDTTKDAKAHLQLSIIFSDATNIDKADVSFNGSTLIDQFERFELSADLRNASPREARIGRWILLYGILQVLSTLSVDVHDLKWTDGVRYFLCTDLKRCPDWVTDGQPEYVEGSQIRSYCWQRPWGPTPLSSRAPAELEGTSMMLGGELESPRSLGGATMLNHDIRRIGEKIDELSVGHGHGRVQRDYERRVDNEKVMQEEFSMIKRRDESFRLSESEYTPRPLVPDRNPMRSPVSPQEYGDGEEQQLGHAPRQYYRSGGDGWI